MQSWILEADIYRIEKALCEAGPQEKLRLKAHLRRAEARLVALLQRQLPA